MYPVIELGNNSSFHQKGFHMNRNVFITGASRGIGFAITQAFAKQGDNLYLCCKTNIALLQEYARSLSEEYHIICKAYQADVSQYEQLAAIWETLPVIDVLINNAGIAKIALLSDTTIEEWNTILATNLSSMFFTSKLAIPGMLQKQAGKIINISSVWGNVGASMEVAYSASKGGVNTFTKALAKELAPSNIQVNAIACGVIDTQMNECLSEEDKLALCTEIPADRFGTASEVADLAVALADAPAYLTGQILTMDGGWT